LQERHCRHIAIASESEAAGHCSPLTLRKDAFKSSELWVPFSLEALVARMASPDKVVVLSVVGNSYRDLLMSWVCGLHHLNISNFVVFALDDELYQFAVLQVCTDSRFHAYKAIRKFRITFENACMTKKMLIKYCTTRAPSQTVQAISLLLVLL
jgi:hypothetical protein